MSKMICILILSVLIAISPNESFAGIDAKLNQSIELVVSYDLRDGVDYGQKGVDIGEGICKAGDGTFCSGSSIGEGICKAGDGTFCSGSSIGEGICKAGNGTFCSGSSIGEGICKAGDGTFCSGSSIGEGICKAGNGAFCSGSSIGEGLCKARGGISCYGMSTEDALKLPVVDTEWKWDQFRAPNSYGNLWACRGTLSGQFADESKCFGQVQIDSWPNN